MMNMRMIKKYIVPALKVSRSESGQVLLILVLVASVLLTIGLSLVENTVQDTQTAKLEEDSKRAEAAADAGIDAAIETGSSVTGSNFVNLFRAGTDISGSAVDSSSSGATFDTPVIPKDQQYTFYASGYNEATETITGTFSDTFRISRLTPSSNDCGGVGQMIVELTAMSTTTGVVRRYLIDPCGVATTGSSTLTTSFDASINIGSAFQLLFVRVVATNDSFGGATFRLTRETGGNWPQQGRTIVSTAETASGVQKTSQLFVSYPQIPADFFVMSM